MSSFMTLRQLLRNTFRLIRRLTRHGKMAEKKSWLKIIGQLKKFIREVGPLWPNSTKLSGYAENGPFHCSDCSFLKKVDGEQFKDDEGAGRCNHPVVIADSE